MAQDENDLPVMLPEELRRQFAEVQRRLWRVETAVALGAAITGLILSLLALFVSDRFWNTPPGLRLAFLLLGLLAIITGFCVWARRWVWRRRSLQDLAILIQKKYRRLGDRLLGIVELAQERHHLTNFSPALYQAAIRQVAEEARQYDFRRSVSAQPAKKIALVTGAAMVCWLAIAFTFPQAAWNTFQRWLAPTAGIPRYTFVCLEGLPRELVVAHGEPFAISGRAQYRSFWRPNRVSGRLPDLPKLEGTVDSGQIRLQIPGQVENGILRVQVGDAQADITILPVHRPSLRELTAHIQLPDYLQYPDQIQTLQSGSLLAVEGSRISFHGKISRALSAAAMQPEGGKAIPLKVDGDTFTSAATQPEGIAEYNFDWQDTLGLSNAAPLRLSVAMQKDAPPTAELPGLPHETAMLVSDVLHIRTEATDDFGVRDLGLVWDVISDVPLAESISTEIKVMPKTSNAKKVARIFLWSPQSFRIPADSSVELEGYARDFLPGRERSRTAPYRIRVLSPEEHAELVREQLEDIMARIEEITRLQEKIVSNLQDAQGNSKLSSSQKTARVGESKQEQLENSSRLNDMSEQAQSALQEAMKNPVFPAETIRQWSQSVRQWQQLAQEKMQQAANSMQAAQQSSQAQQMADATQKAEDILDELEKMQAKADQHLDELHALTLAERLHKLSGQEKDMSAQLLNSAPDIIGLPPAELPAKLQHFEHALTSEEGLAQKESDTLQGEISRFFERTKKTNYGEVSQEMKDARTSDELERLGGMINDNIAIQASGNLGQWSERFQLWSDKLKPKTESSGGGQGSNGQSGAKDLTEQLIALLRLRENEMTLRDQTSVLDQQKGPPATFKERACSLADTQKKLAGNLEQIDQNIGLTVLEPIFQQTGGAMQHVETILRTPQTGQPADDAEAKTIGLVSDVINLINEQAQHNSAQQSASSDKGEEMAFLMRMMQKTANAKAMALQPAGGPNSRGGTTSRAANPVTGNVAGKGAAARNVDKATGIIDNSPAEFRDALDNYFHGIEQSKD